MSIVDRMEIIKHYVDELKDLQVSEIPDYLSAILGITRGVAQELLVALETLQLPDKCSRRRLRRRGLSKDLASYLVPRQIPPHDYEIDIRHGPYTTTYCLWAGLVIKKPELFTAGHGWVQIDGGIAVDSAILVCGRPKEYRYWVKDVDRLSWFDLNTHKTNRVEVWRLAGKHKLTETHLILRAEIRHILIELDGSYKLSRDYEKGEKLRIPLVDKMRMETVLGQVYVRQVIFE